MTKIIYFDADFDTEEYGSPIDYTNEQIVRILDEVKRGDIDGVHIYDSIEDFCTAFNHEYISDLGYVRTIEK